MRVTPRQFMQYIQIHLIHHTSNHLAHNYRSCNDNSTDNACNRNDSQPSGKQTDIYCFPAHNELGTSRASLGYSEQSVLSILMQTHDTIQLKTCECELKRTDDE